MIAASRPTSGDADAAHRRPRYVAISGRDWLECHSVDVVYAHGRRRRVGYSASFGTAWEIARAYAEPISLLVSVRGEILLSNAQAIELAFSNFRDGGGIDF